MKTFGKVMAVLLAVLFLITMISFVTPIGRAFWNNYDYTLNKIDEGTKYKIRKGVEDTCRAMMASYKSDCMTYDQYKNSDSKEEKVWAAQAKMRANKTAASYNEYILKNSYVWNNNVPSDIKTTIDYIN